MKTMAIISSVVWLSGVTPILAQTGPQDPPVQNRQHQDSSTRRNQLEQDGAAPQTPGAASEDNFPLRYQGNVVKPAGMPHY